MRRTTRKAVSHLSIFGAMLCFILFVNRPQSKTTTFTWTKIRYQTTASSLPEARGRCPGLSETSKPALVVARISTDDTTWLEGLKSKYHLCIYTSNAPLDLKSNSLQIPQNRAHESMPYLTFLIDNYSFLPSAGAVFIHGSQKAWHNDSPDYSNLALLHALDIPSALHKYGYHNLRCDWSLSTCPASYVPQGSLDTRMQAALEPWDRKAVSDAALSGALGTLFGTEGGTLGRTETLRSQCCAQFVVSQAQMRSHSREEYVALRQWLLDGSSGNVKNAAPTDDRVAGRIVSYLWHVLFLKTTDGGVEGGVDVQMLGEKACPSARECYCTLYGRCGLEGCTTGACRGEYELPRDLKVPKG